MGKNAPNFFWVLFQILVCESLGAGIVCLPVYLIPTPTVKPDIVGPLIAGMSVFIGIWITGATTGGQINPMITLAAVITRRTPLIQLPIYFVAQFLGVMTGLGISWWVSPHRPTKLSAYGLTMPGDNVSLGIAIFMEIVATLILVLVWLASQDEVRDLPWRIENGNNFPLAMLIVNVVMITIVAPVSGASMNPFRSIGAAVIQNSYDRQWIYFVGPPIGTIFACLIYELLICPFSSVRRARMWLCSREFDRRDKGLSDVDVTSEQGNAAF